MRIMKCEDVRLLLAAYRRGDWSLDEQRAANRHLAGCAACRKWELEARHVGEQLRQLPTITPPASLRASVYAAIRAEELAEATRAAERAPAVVAMTKTPTGPLPATPASPVAQPIAARVGEVALGRMRPPRAILGRSTAIATIAAVLALMVGMQLMPILGSHTPTQFVNSGPGSASFCINLSACQLTPYSVIADPTFSNVTSVFASDKQVIYVGVSSSGQSMILAHDRTSDRTVQLLPAPATKPLTLVALTTQLVVWLVGTPQGAWTLQADPLSNGDAAPIAKSPLILAQSGESLSASGLTMGALSSLWADGQSVLLVVTTSIGQEVLARIDRVATPAPVATATATATPTTPPMLQIVSRSAVNHSIVDPYLDGTMAYWVDMTIGPGGVPQGVIWSETADGTLSQLTANASAFGPVASGTRLLWFQTAQAALISQGVGGALSPTLYGTVEWRYNDSAAPSQVTAGLITSADLWRGGGFVLVRDSTHAYAYRLADGYRLDVPLPDRYDALGLSATSIAWSMPPQNSNTPQDVILVVDLS